MTDRRIRDRARPRRPSLDVGVRAGDIEIGVLSVASGVRLPRLALDEIEALLVLSGSLIVRGEGQAPTTIRQGAGIVRWLAVPLHISAAADATIVTTRVAVSARDNTKDRERRDGWRPLPPQAADALRTLHRTLPATSQNVRLVEGLAMVATAWAESALASAAEVVDRPHWLHRVTSRLNDTMERPTVESLARDAGVTPTHLARAFRQAEGCTVGEYHRRVRIDAACRLMQDPDLPLSVIAAATGFADHAHLSKAFRKATGVTPREYRRAAAHESMIASAAAPAFDPTGRYSFRSRTAGGTQYDGVIVLERAGNSWSGVVQTSVMPDVPIETVAVHGRRLVLTTRVPAGLAILDVQVRGAELEGEWRLAGKPTAVRGRRCADPV